MEKILMALPPSYLYSQEQLKNQRLNWYLNANHRVITASSHQNFALFMDHALVNIKTAKSSIPLLTNPIKFSNHQSFINQLMPYAQAAAKKLALNPGVLIAQAALETNWGQAMIKNNKGQNSYNLFNIKATDKNTKSITVSTKEYNHHMAKRIQASFKMYDSFENSFEDYTRLIKTNQRYHNTLNAVDNPKQYFIALQKAGYATDPFYAEKAWTIYQQLIKT